VEIWAEASDVEVCDEGDEASVTKEQIRSGRVLSRLPRRLKLARKTPERSSSRSLLGCRRKVSPRRSPLPHVQRRIIVVVIVAEVTLQLLVIVV
jgi:hypothetical protein